MSIHALANQIAEKLVDLKELGKQKLSTQKRLDELKDEIKAKTEELNKTEETIRTVKYQINELMNEQTIELRVFGE